MESITIYGVGKYRDDIMTISKEEAALLLMELYKALASTETHVKIIMPIVITKT